MKLRFLGAHNVETQTCSLPSLLLDGVIAFDCGSVSRSLDTEAILKVNNVFITHQHFDHIRDVMTVAMVNNQASKCFDMYGNSDTLDAIKDHFFNHTLYCDFFERGNCNYTVLEEGQIIEIGDYQIIPHQMNHGVRAFGYLVKKDKSSFFYTGDTGIGNNWEGIKPDILIIEVTGDNSLSTKYQNGPHLTPELLRKELLAFKTSNGYIPKTYLVHLNPVCEKQIEKEIEDISKELGIKITLASENLEIEI